MAANLGAHEVMEIHEVLNGTVDAMTIRTARSARADQRLAQFFDHQLQLPMTKAATTPAMVTCCIARVPVMRALPPVNNAFQPTYGLDHPGTVSPNTSPELDDRESPASCSDCTKRPRRRRCSPR